MCVCKSVESIRNLIGFTREGASRSKNYMMALIVLDTSTKQWRKQPASYTLGYSTTQMVAVKKKKSTITQQSQNTNYFSTCPLLIH